MEAFPPRRKSRWTKRSGPHRTWADMNLPLVLHEHATAIRALTKRHPAINPRVFGSMAAGRYSPESDLDLLVDALPGATLLDLGALQIELEALLGVKVDLLTPADLPPAFREQVLAEARPV